jgi:hypothetical protein
MDFYPAKNNDRLNRQPFEPERVSGRVMVNPRYLVRRLARVAPWWCRHCRAIHTFPRVRCDSGAFQDTGKKRLFPWQALEAQLRFEEQLRWRLDDASFHFETIFIYDDPISREARMNGDSAAEQVANTIASARYYASQRHRIRGGIGWVGQGIKTEEFVDCVQAQLAWFRPGDVVGFGGFAAWGRMSAVMTPFAHETISRVVDLARRRGAHSFHLLGVMYAPAVRWVAQFAHSRRVRFALDGSGPEQAACIAGAVYRPDGTQDHGIYTKEQKYQDYYPCDLALQNIAAYTQWTNSLRTRSSFV